VVRKETQKIGAALDSRPERSLGFQDELGLFKTRRLEQHALVLSQGWPSWTFGLEGLGFKSVSTIAAFPSLSSREEFRATEMSSTLMGGDKLHPWLVDHSSDGILFVQGEREYLEAAHHKLDEFENIQVIYACSDPSFWSADRARVSHKNCGGVTDGEWTIYSEGI